MVELGYNPIQEVAPNTGVILNNIIKCRRGLVRHRDESSNTILRSSGICNCPNSSTYYQVTFNGNVAIPTGGTLGEINIGLVLDGSVIPTSIAKTTPTVVDSYSNVTSTGIAQIPNGCCQNISVFNLTTGQSINVQNANVTITAVNN